MSLAKLIQEENGTKDDSKKETKKSKEKPVSSDIIETESIVTKNQVTRQIPLIDLYSWFDKYHRQSKTFEPKVRATTIQILDALVNERLVVTVLHPNGGTHPETTNPLRKIVTFDGANTYNVIDRPGMEFDLYGDNSARIIYHIEDNLYIKCYCVGTGLKLMYSTMVEGRMIPFTERKINKSKATAYLYSCEPAKILQRLNVRFDKEALILRYSQFRRKSNEIKTKIDAIDWLIDRSKPVMDINHQILIDRSIISIVDLK